VSVRELTTDVAIIGAGTAGLNARREVERAGKRWLLIESGPYGTTCARSGCMPSKLLIAAADAARSARAAHLFGVQIAPEAIRVDGQAVLERVRRERDRFVELGAQPVEALPPERRIHGRARFVDANTIEIDQHTRVRANAIVVATGSTPVVPKELAAIADVLLTSDSLFELPTLPTSIAVFGTGAIGLELGQALQALGSRVVFYNPVGKIGPFSDPLIADRFRALICAESSVIAGVELVDVRRDGDELAVRHRDARGQTHETRFASVLAAVGRKPEFTGLELAAAGVTFDDKGAPVCDHGSLQCGATPVFLAGDVSGYRPILHEAVDEGCVAGANAAAFPKVREQARRVPLNIGFTHPQLATVGMTFKQASQLPDVVYGEASYEDQGRARVMGQNQGHVRVYATRAGQRLVGAELFGPAVEHSAHLLAWAIQSELPLSALLRMPVYHPTLEEGIRTALRDLGQGLQLLEGCSPADRGTGPGS
jgi:dihydrolipoamide dehydrogenase